MTPAADTAPWKTARRLLAVRLDNLGDLLMTTPALLAMKRAAPDVHLALLSSPSGAALAPCLPWVDELIVAEVPWMKNGSGGPDDAADLGRREAELVQRLARGPDKPLTQRDRCLALAVCPRPNFRLRPPRSSRWP